MPKHSILSAKDIDRIRKALLAWGKPASAVSLFNEKMLRQQIEIWKNVVQFEWTRDLVEKYQQDIAVRYWIQIAIEHSEPKAAGRIHELVAPHDAHFQSIMKPRPFPASAGKAPLSGHPYFWEENSIVR